MEVSTLQEWPPSAGHFAYEKPVFLTAPSMQKFFAFNFCQPKTTSIKIAAQLGTFLESHTINLQFCHKNVD